VPRQSGDAPLSDLEAELEQLAMNARRSPQGIFRADPPDQRASVSAKNVAAPSA
jgi:hypothetical protein